MRWCRYSVAAGESCSSLAMIEGMIFRRTVQGYGPLLLLPFFSPSGLGALNNDAARGVLMGGEGTMRLSAVISFESYGEIGSCEHLGLDLRKLL